MSLDNDIDELFKKLNAKKEVIDKMVERERKRKRKKNITRKIRIFTKIFSFKL